MLSGRSAMVRWLVPGAVVVAMAMPAVLRAAEVDAAAKEKRANVERQQGGGREVPGQRMLERFRSMLDGLNLSDDQKRSIDQFFADAQKEFQQAREEAEKANLQPRERMEKFRPIVQNLREKVSGVLTEEQRTALREKVQERRAEGGGPTSQPAGQQRGGLMQRFQEVAGQLNLTDDQKTQLQTILADARQKMQQIREDAQGDQQAAREKIGQLMRDTREQVMRVLTPEQQQKLNELLPEHGNRQGGAGHARRGQGHGGANQDQQQ